VKRSKKPLEYYLIAVLFTLLILVCFLQVLFRFVLSLPLAWTEELSRYLFILLVYVGASAAAGEGKHVRVEIIDSAKATKALNIIVQLLCALISLVIAFNLKDMILNANRMNQQSAALRLPMAVLYVLVAAMFVLIAARFLQRIVYLMKKGEDET